MTNADLTRDGRSDRGVDVGIASLAKRLQCPATGMALNAMTLADAAQTMGRPLTAIRTNGIAAATPVGPTSTVLVRSDQRLAYPVVDGAPVLLGPEALGAEEDCHDFDLDLPAFNEAYLEMDYYNQIGFEEASSLVGSEDHAIIETFVARGGRDLTSFPDPTEIWIDAVFDAPAQLDAYSALAPVANRRMAQVGGKGTHVIKFLVGGAATGVLITPMLGEAAYARALAEAFGVSKKLDIVVGVAEQMPLVDACLDGVYVTGSMHHMECSLAMPEIYRCLDQGGAFSAIEPYRAPMYAIGTKVFGKREPNAHCSPLDEDRLAVFRNVFQEPTVNHHGVLFRYPRLALWKLGVNLPPSVVRRLDAADEVLVDRLGSDTRWGSSLAIKGSKTRAEATR